MISRDNKSVYINGTPLDRIGNPLLAVFAFMALAGIFTFIYGLTGPDTVRIWRAFLVNFVWLTGLSFGALLFSALLNITNARWGRPLKRLSEALGSSAPISFLLFWVLYFGRKEIFVWIREPVPEKAAWLNPGFMFARDGIGLLILTLVAIGIIYHSVSADKKFLSAGDKGLNEVESQIIKHFNAQKNFSIAYGVLYAVVLSLIAFDLLMSLDPHWYSSLFGAYYFIGSFYTGLAMIEILAILAVRYMGQGVSIAPSQFHDLGKLMLGFCLMTGDFFYTQFFVIWYGNLSEETRYLLLRLQKSPWDHIAWVVLIATFAVPFLVLLNRKVKMMHIPMLILSVVIIAGMGIERFLLVAPAMHVKENILFGWIELLITAGFLGLMGLCVLTFLKNFPVIPVSDPLFIASIEKSRGKTTEAI
jgi:Ni/Fe-hydrogenase subunit HybB-like protein